MSYQRGGREEDENVDVVDLSDDAEDDVDEEAYQGLNHNLVGCKITAFYPDEGGWFKGCIAWYNTQLCKLRVYFEEDSSDDYIAPDELNGVDVILCV